jgi:hypothetical protein
MIKSRRVSMAGLSHEKGIKRNSYGLLVGKPEGKRPLERPKHWWIDNIEMDLGVIGWS